MIVNVFKNAPFEVVVSGYLAGKQAYSSKLIGDHDLCQSDRCVLLFSHLEFCYFEKKIYGKRIEDLQVHLPVHKELYYLYHQV